MVTFRTEGLPCVVCRLRPRGVELVSVRINRRSLRTLGLTLGASPWVCDECRTPLRDDAGVTVRRWLDPTDAAKVAAYRARRWPEPTDSAEPASIGAATADVVPAGAQSGAESREETP
jgi:hypothetical protein